MDEAIRVIAFDVDGTLYGKAAYGSRMFCSLFPDPFLALRYSRARKAYRVEQAASPTVGAGRDGYLSRLASLMGSRNERRTVRAVERQMYGCWRRVYRKVRPRPLMRETLLLLKKKGYRLAVLSDFPLEGKLKALGIASLVDVALCSEDTGYLKPDGRVFDALLASVHARPEEVLFVGDSYHKDVLGAKGAGMRSCLLTNRRRIYPDADYVVHSFKEFAVLFN